MPQSPIVAGSEISTPVGGVQMNGAAMRDAALAPGRLGEAIGQDVGALFGGISAKIQEARNAKKVFDADLSMRATKDKFLNDIATDPNLAKDSNTWVPALTERVKATQESIMGDPTLAPVVKRHLEQVTGLWGMETISEVRTQALRKEQVDLKEAGFASARAALANSSPNDGGAGEAAATAAYKALNEHGIIGPRETAQLIAQAPVMAAEAQVNNVIATDPTHAPDVIEKNYASKLPDLKYKSALRSAYQAQAAAQSRNEQGWSARVTDDPLHAVNEEALKADRDDKQISARGYDQIVAKGKSFATAATAAQNKKETDDYRGALLEADFPPTDAKTLNTWAQSIKAEGLAWTNAAHTRHLNDYVDAKVKSVLNTGRKEENPIENQIYSMMDEDRTHQGSFVPMEPTQASTGWFSPKETKMVRYNGTLEDLRNMNDRQIKQQFGENATKESVSAAEQINYAKKKDEMRQWFAGELAAGRKPTIEQANEARMKIEAPDVQAAVVHSLTKQPRLVKQNGKTYNFDTGEEVK